MNLKAINILLAISAPFFIFGADQNVTITVKQQSTISMDDATLSSSDFDLSENGVLKGTTSVNWNYFNNEQGNKTEYKVIGQVSSPKADQRPKGWSLFATMHSPSDTEAFGTPTGTLLEIPFSDKKAASFIQDLPQGRTGNGNMDIQVAVDKVENFTKDQHFVVTWTIATE